MLIVACQKCGEITILSGSPDSDGMARVGWACRHCGTGQSAQFPVAVNAANSDLRSILPGLSLGSDGGYVIAGDIRSGD